MSAICCRSERGTASRDDVFEVEAFEDEVGFELEIPESEWTLLRRLGVREDGGFRSKNNI